MSTTNSGATPTSGLAIVCLVLGILTLLSFWMLYLVLAPGALAILLGALAVRETRRGTASGKGLATAGILCAILGMIPTALTSVVLALALIFGEPKSPPDASLSSPTVMDGDGPATAAGIAVTPEGR